MKDALIFYQRAEDTLNGKIYFLGILNVEKLLEI